jgi:hypothetical protein
MRSENKWREGGPGTAENRPETEQHAKKITTKQPVTVILKKKSSNKTFTF